MILDDPIHKFFVGVIFLTFSVVFLPVWVIFGEIRISLAFLLLAIFMFVWLFLETKYADYKIS